MSLLSFQQTLHSNTSPSTSSSLISKRSTTLGRYHRLFVTAVLSSNASVFRFNDIIDFG